MKGLGDSAVQTADVRRLIQCVSGSTDDAGNLSL
jgi:hypothetical protein